MNPMMHRPLKKFSNVVSTALAVGAMPAWHARSSSANEQNMTNTTHMEPVNRRELTRRSSDSGSTTSKIATATHTRRSMSRPITMCKICWLKSAMKMSYVNSEPILPKIIIAWWTWRPRTPRTRDTVLS